MRERYDNSTEIERLRNHWNGGLNWRSETLAFEGEGTSPSDASTSWGLDIPPESIRTQWEGAEIDYSVTETVVERQIKREAFKRSSFLKRATKLSKALKAIPILGYLLYLGDAIDIYLWLDDTIHDETGHHIHDWIASRASWHSGIDSYMDASILERLAAISLQTLDPRAAVVEVTYMLAQLAYLGYQVTDPEYGYMEFVTDGASIALPGFVQSNHALGTGESIVTSPTGSTGHSIP